ncbi:hypothetical protein SETIT_4G211500v2, partial [Setaria italica]
PSPFFPFSLVCSTPHGLVRSWPGRRPGAGPPPCLLRSAAVDRPTLHADARAQPRLPRSSSSPRGAAAPLPAALFRPRRPSPPLPTPADGPLAPPPGSASSSSSSRRAAPSTAHPRPRLVRWVVPPCAELVVSHGARRH